MAPSRRATARVTPGPASPPPPGSSSRVERLRAAVDEQQGRCFWCGREFSSLVPPTTDHLVPRVKGGPSWRENEVAACRRCNAQRGHLAPVDWMEECRRRGWAADAGRLATTLSRLDDAIAARGGQRRARPYLQGQRRRLEHLAD
ncbi:HNH endonuclease [Cellulomonas sp. ATA003]|uniref:HNH endonuclease n=1 Tax=Cellulomonas sp. ATA003 TaxID=3073064 RepID=UPI002872C78B|nr:HNH endonuclease [Cellulomonas sp. ATA003]WNB86882.1 HNH endonuclease [Cellulomonas sp. ATA003]